MIQYDTMIIKPYGPIGMEFSHTIAAPHRTTYHSAFLLVIVGGYYKAKDVLFCVLGRMLLSVIVRSFQAHLH